MSANERLMLEAVRHRLLLLRYSNSQANAMIKLLRQAKPSIWGKVLEKVMGLNLGNMSPAKLRIIARAVLSQVKSEYQAIYLALEKELAAFAQAETTYYHQQLTGTHGIAEIMEIKGAQVALADHKQVLESSLDKPIQNLALKGWFDKLPEDVTRAIMGGVQQGVTQGKSTMQIINELKASGTMGNAERNLATIVHSSISHVAADARERTAQANEDLIKERLWLSTLDNLTSPMCIVRDHIRYTMKQPIMPVVKGDPPYGAGPGKLHFRCRSVETWILKSWDDMAPGGDVSKRTRASLDGQVPEKMNYRQWLEERASIAVQDEVLGIVRAELLRNGKLKVGDFYDDGKMISLAELYKKHPEAMK